MKLLFTIYLFFFNFALASIGEECAFLITHQNSIDVLKSSEDIEIEDVRTTNVCNQVNTSASGSFGLNKLLKSLKINGSYGKFKRFCSYDSMHNRTDISMNTEIRTLNQRVLDLYEDCLNTKSGLKVIFSRSELNDHKVFIEYSFDSNQYKGKIDDPIITEDSTDWQNISCKKFTSPISNNKIKTECHIKDIYETAKLKLNHPNWKVNNLDSYFIIIPRIIMPHCIDFEVDYEIESDGTSEMEICLDLGKNFQKDGILNKNIYITSSDIDPSLFPVIIRNSDKRFQIRYTNTRGDYLSIYSGLELDKTNKNITGKWRDIRRSGTRNGTVKAKVNTKNYPVSNDFNLKKSFGYKSITYSSDKKSINYVCLDNSGWLVKYNDNKTEKVDIDTSYFKMYKNFGFLTIVNFESASCA